MGGAVSREEIYSTERAKLEEEEAEARQQQQEQIQQQQQQRQEGVATQSGVIHVVSYRFISRILLLRIQCSTRVFCQQGIRRQTSVCHKSEGDLISEKKRFKSVMSFNSVVFRIETMSSS